jgi:TonB family protein
MLWLLPALTQAQPAACPQSSPLSEDQLTELVKGSVPAARVGQLVAGCGIAFDPTGDAIGRLRSAGASQTTLDAVQAAEGPAERSWESIKNSQDPAVFEDYLHQYPNGKFAVPAGQKYRALRVAGARGEIESALAAGQWDAAEARIQDLLHSVPEDEDIKAWQRRAADGREAERKQKEEAALKAEQTAWDLVKDRSEAELFEQFLRDYPAGQYAGAARLKLAALKAAATPPTPAATVTPPATIPARPMTPARQKLAELAPAAGESGNASKPAQPLVVDAKVESASLVHSVPPVYPPQARKSRVQGHVLLRAVISKEGAIEELQVISGDPLLAPAAVAAVKQWVYKPTLVNQEPVAVSTEIDIDFSLK